MCIQVRQLNSYLFIVRACANPIAIKNYLFTCNALDPTLTNDGYQMMLNTRTVRLFLYASSRGCLPDSSERQQGHLKGFI